MSNTIKIDRCGFSVDGAVRVDARASGPAYDSPSEFLIVAYADDVEYHYVNIFDDAVEAFLFADEIEKSRTIDLALWHS